MGDRSALALFALGLGLFCAIGLLIGMDHRAWTFGLTALTVSVMSIITVRAARHAHLASRLRRRSEPARMAGLTVHAGEIGDAAFVAGIRRPAIFCDRSLPDRLSPGELRAVMLHERAHQAARDPARLLLLGLLTPLLGWLPRGRRWLASRLAAREIAADRYALAHGATLRDLASALLRLPPLTRAHVAGFTPAVELRLRALLGDEVAVEAPPALRRGVALGLGAIGGAITCTWFLHPALAATLGVLCC